MAWFSKKKEEGKKDLPPLKFPDFDNFPKYESGISHDETAEIKSAVQLEEENAQSTLPSTEFKPLPEFKPAQPEEEATPLEQEPIAEETQEEFQAIKPREVSSRDKPLFIKIDRYKETMDTIATIKDRITDCQNIMNNIEELKQEEDRQLERWRADLELIKEKLFLIDHKLFEDG